ncbi:MAG: ABC transporter substrate-binding protein [Rhodopseudomonas palustris]|uniref:ABC transporter substrate-binding protein n=1 Tax=Rhodopseudomonas palustris TaxID=1076 RepID=A0A933S6K2_RHOPL|nr:ABC transporter substrate-binding protein [Rhodopseudomonas palustris]
MRSVAGLLGILACLAGGPTYAGDKSGTVKLGVLTDMTGVYSDLTGNGSVEAAKMAIEKFGGKVDGRPIELVFADHQNKADVGLGILRRWYEVDDVDATLDFANSAVALGAVQVTRDFNRVMIPSGVGTTDLTGSKCSPNTIHWTWDSYGNANALVRSVIRQGGKKWFFITVDYAFGHSLEDNVSKIVKASGAEVLGAVRHPLNTSDFSSYLLTAQSSGADVIVLASGGADLSNAIKQGREFGITSDKFKLVAPQFNLAVVHAAGLEATRGLLAAGSLNWTKNETTRAFASELAKRNRGIHPDALQAGVYSSVLAYLGAVAKLKTTDGRKIVEYLKSLPVVQDPLLGDGVLRADGRMTHPVQIFQVKSPGESKEPWDYFKTIDEIPADQAFRPLSESECPLVKAAR